jgi:hypothetical protein
MDIKSILLHALIKYDERQSKTKYYNFYALPQYLQALDNTMKEYNKGIPIQDAINNNFLGSLASYVLKAAGKIQESTLQESKFAIDSKQLRDAFPEIYRLYNELYEGGRPKITVNTTTEYSFHPQFDDSLSDLWYNEAWIIQHDGHVELFDSSEPENGRRAQSYKIAMMPGDAVLECHYGNAKYCTMYVHPDFMNPEQLTGPTDLLATEEWIILMFKSYIPKVRFEYFSRGARGDEYAFRIGNGAKAISKDEVFAEMKVVSKEYQLKTMKDLYEFFLKKLAEKGLLKISSNGAAQLTMDGKNVALSLGSY